MLKKYFIIFSFIFSIFIFAFQNKVNAYSLPTNGCSFNSATATIDVFTADDLKGSIPLCFTNDNTSDVLRLKTGGTFYENSAFVNNLGKNIGTTEYTFTGNTKYEVNFEKNFSALPVNNVETNFFLSDNINPIVSARYTLTLRPAFRVKFLNHDYAD